MCHLFIPLILDNIGGSGEAKHEEETAHPRGSPGGACPLYESMAKPPTHTTRPADPGL